MLHEKRRMLVRQNRVESTFMSDQDALKVPVELADMPEANELLKRSFRQLHDKVVGAINVAAVRDHLFQNEIISEEDYRTLSHVGMVVHPIEQCRQLMSLLYAGSHPDAFVQLRLAINKEAAYRWLVELVDEQFRRIVLDPDKIKTSTDLTEAPLSPPPLSPTIEIVATDEVDGKQTVLNNSKPVSKPVAEAAIIAYKRRPLQLTCLHVDGRGTNSGVAELNRQLFVITEGTDTFQVYDRSLTGSPYVRREVLRIKGLKSPTDIAACGETNRLYIVDGSEHSVWMVESAAIITASVRHQTSVSAERWIKTTDYEPWTLSCRWKRVVVIPWSGTKLFVFRADGKLLRRIALPAHMVALHAVETSRDTLIVCHVGRADKTHDQVSEVDVLGRVIRVFGGQRGGSLDQVNEPRYVALDSDGRVLVADCSNQRVLLLTSDLRLDRVLLTAGDDGLEPKPWRLCLVEHSAELIVTHSESKDIEVYRVRPK